MRKESGADTGRLVTTLAEFSEPRLENRYRFSEQRRSAIQIAWVSGVTSPFTLAFTALDFTLFGFSGTFWTLLVARLVVAAILGGIAYIALNNHEATTSGICATLGECIVLGELLLDTALYPASYVSIYGQGITLFVLAVAFVVPNRWILSTGVQITAIAGFLSLSALRLGSLTAPWDAMTSLLIFAGFIGIISSHRLHRAQRLHYHDMRGVKDANFHLRRAAHTDTLTGLLNRRRFLQVARDSYFALQAKQLPCSVLFFDVDRFKAINDQFGHSMGDQCLRHIAAICRAFFRRGDPIGRIGGEEFAIFLEDTDEAAAATLAERLRADIEHGHSPLADHRPLTVTIGAAERTSADPDVESLLQRADQAMYLGKELGRNRVVRASPPSAPEQATAVEPTSLPAEPARTRLHVRHPQLVVRDRRR